MDEHTNCIFCNRAVRDLGSSAEIRSLQCPNCGKYALAGSFLNFRHWHTLRDPNCAEQFPLQQDKHVVSGYLREMTEKGTPVEPITLDNWEQVLAQAQGHAPQNVQAQLERLLKHIARLTQGGGSPIIPYMPAVVYAQGRTELMELVKSAERRELVTGTFLSGGYAFRVTTEGREWLERADTPHSAQGTPQPVIYNTTITGSTVGNVLAGVHNSTVHATATLTVNDPAAFTALADQLIAALREENGLSPLEREEVTDLLQVAQETLATDKPKPGLLSSCAKRLKEVADTAKAGATVTKLALKAWEWLGPFVQQYCP